MSTASEWRVLRVAVGSSNPAKVDAVLHALRACLDRHDIINDNNNNNNNSSSSSSSKEAMGARTAPDEVSLEVEGFPVDSGVEAQPVGDERTRLGAENRAYAAYLAYKKKNGQYPHLAISMEGGVEFRPGPNSSNMKSDCYCMAWVVVYGKRQAFTVDLFASRGETVLSYYGDKRPFWGKAKTAAFPLPPSLTRLMVDQNMELGDADDAFFGRTNSKRGSGTVGVLTDNLIPRAAYYEHAIQLALIPWIRPDLYPPLPPPLPQQQIQKEQRQQPPPEPHELLLKEESA